MRSLTIRICNKFDLSPEDNTLPITHKGQQAGTIANAGAVKILVDYCDKLGLEHYNVIKFTTTTLPMKSSYDQLTKNTNHVMLKMTRYVL
jgi:hypothetical protein